MKLSTICIKWIAAFVDFQKSAMYVPCDDEDVVLWEGSLQVHFGNHGIDSSIDLHPKRKDRS